MTEKVDAASLRAVRTVIGQSTALLVAVLLVSCGGGGSDSGARHDASGKGGASAGVAGMNAGAAGTSAGSGGARAAGTGGTGGVGGGSGAGGGGDGGGAGTAGSVGGTGGSAGAEDAGADVAPADGSAGDAEDAATTCDGGRIFCVYQTGPTCSDVGQPSACMNGAWVCPSGTVPTSSCGGCIGATPPGCVCSGGTLQCSDAGQTG